MYTYIPTSCKTPYLLPFSRLLMKAYQSPKFLKPVLNPKVKWSNVTPGKENTWRCVFYTEATWSPKMSTEPLLKSNQIDRSNLLIGAQRVLRWGSIISPQPLCRGVTKPRSWEPYAVFLIRRPLLKLGQGWTTNLTSCMLRELLFIGKLISRKSSP